MQCWLHIPGSSPSRRRSSLGTFPSNLVPHISWYNCSRWTAIFPASTNIYELRYFYLIAIDVMLIAVCVGTKKRWARTVYFSEQRSCVQRQRLLTRSSAIAEGPRDASCQLKSCQLSCNSAETTCTTSPEEIEVMNLQRYGGPMCNQRVHSTMTRSRRFHCPVGVINKPPTDELWLSPVYRRLEVGGVAQW